MSTATPTSPLERLLDPLAAGFSSEMAPYIAEFRADPGVQIRIKELAEKANDGEMTEAERQEYAEFVDAGTLIAILQAKARKRLEAGAS
jgi:hypothetical protein